MSVRMQVAFTGEGEQSLNGEAIEETEDGG